MGLSTGEPWRFGAEPLDQTVEVARLLRRLAGLALSLEDEQGAVVELIEILRGTEDTLARLAPADLLPRVGERAQGEGRVYLDHAFDIGAFNPAFPQYAIDVDGDRATGSVEFPVVYEGPPGLVHGGFVALLADAAVQHHNCQVGQAGKTTSLTVEFVRPTPLFETLAFEIDRRIEGRRIGSEFRLRHGDTLLCTARVEAVAGDRSRLPEVSPRRA
jgi:hypothetical protein